MAITEFGPAPADRLPSPRTGRADRDRPACAALTSQVADQAQRPQRRAAGPRPRRARAIAARSVIRDVVEFRRSGLARRRIADLSIPVEAWRAAIRQAGRRTDTPVHTFLVPPRPATAVEREDQVVYAVRTDPPPDAAGIEHRLLWWRPVDELDMPVRAVRSTLHRFARADRPPWL